MPLTIDAAVKIQTLYREKARRPHHNQENNAPVKDLEHAALTIQRLFRNSRSRTRSAKQYQRAHYRDAAARKIQSVWKKHKSYS